MNKRALILGGALLCSTALLADVPRQDARLHAPLPTGLDNDIGEVWFKVRESSGERMRLTPVVAVDLEVVRVRGEDNPPSGLIKCMMTERVLIFDQNAPPPQMVTLTVAKCPGNREYATKQVIFDVAKNSK